MRYRRADVTGGTYFFTVNLAHRHLRLLLDHVEILREAVKTVKRRHPFRIDAFVVLPDHLHAIWTLPPDDADFATRWMLIKSDFSRKIVMNERRNASRIAKGERGIWQRRYWEHLIRDERDFERHVDYIHYNPVKHGYVHTGQANGLIRVFTGISRLGSFRMIGAITLITVLKAVMASGKKLGFASSPQPTG